MRLIDADLFKQQMAAMALTSPYFFTSKVVKLLEIIDKQPTAYDPEVVVKQLEEEIQWAEQHGTDKIFRQGRISGLKTAIRFVRNGGVK